MRIVIAGGTGLIGQKLTDILLESGHEVIILTRKPKPTRENVMYVQWLEEDTSPENEIGKADVFVNLAGVSINNGRWTGKHQQDIYNSRMQATDELLRIVAALPTTEPVPSKKSRNIIRLPHSSQLISA